MLSATVRVEDQPAVRRVVAIELDAAGQWRVCGDGKSDESGVVKMAISGMPSNTIYAVAIDDWGQPFAPSLAVSYGDIVRPSNFLGWVYVATEPGVLPNDEPDWWNSRAGIPQPVGTAMMQATRHYQPIAHGPVTDIEWVGVEFDPHWSSVVSLLHFNGDLTDETGGTWTGQGYSFEESGTGLGLMLKTANDGFAMSSFNVGLTSSEPYTIEFFLKKQTSGTTATPFSLYESSTNRMGLYFNNQTAARLWQNANTISGTVDMYQMHHYAIVGMGDNTHRLFIDGFQVGSSSRVISISGTLNLGRAGPSTEPYSGLIGELRVTKGVARYTENFTPPTSQFPSAGPVL